MSLVGEQLEIRNGDYTVSVDRLEIGAGECLCVMGTSGAGKSTLLLALAGFLPLERGTLRLGGIAVESLPPEKRKLALAFQRATLFPHLTVAGNVEFGLKAQCMSAPERKERVMAWLARLGLTALAGRRANELSEGQAQRVALARALAVGFPGLLLDEPFSALDVSTRVGLRERLRELIRETKTACVLVTHHPDDALAVGDRLMLLDAGQVAWEGRPADLPRELPVVRKFFP